MQRTPRSFNDVAECVEQTLSRVGNRVVLALPLGIGKPAPLANEFYRRARRDPKLKLEVFSALSLHPPIPRSELERRLLEPLNARLFGCVVELDYVRDLHAGKLPPNVTITEFFLEPGGLLNVEHAQQHYVSTNYTHVARDVAAHGVNVIAQLVAKRGAEARTGYSLGSNPDVTLDLLTALEPERARGRDVVVIGEVNRQMPFMFGPAQIRAENFDYLIDDARYDYDLFAPPNPELGTVEYAIGLNCAALVKDGGTLQLGIGELGDAVVYALQLRQQQNGEFREVLQNLGFAARAPEAAALGGLEPLQQGVYACTEMFVDGFLELYRCGVLKRRVYPHLRLQELLNDGAISERVDETMLAALAASGFASLDEAQFDLLQGAGVFRGECRYQGGALENGEGLKVAARLDSAAARVALLKHCAAKTLNGGVLLHGGFFLGPRGFYAALRDMPDSERRQFAMCGVGFVNQLDGEDHALRHAQRRDARFMNSAMMMTLLGAAVSDGLADGRVVSGVGGQYNFVAMAHALKGGRSILSLRSTRSKEGRLTSNIVFNYGHVTIPRHLKDVVVTEYGVADLRGLADAQVIAALLAIADSRFQEPLLAEAKAHGKIARDYQIPERHRNNTPQALNQQFVLPRARGLFTEFPFGTDLSREEVLLARALTRLKHKTQGGWSKFATVLAAAAGRGVPSGLRPHLKRMGLEAPTTRSEWLWQRLLINELKALT